MTMRVDPGRLRAGRDDASRDPPFELDNHLFFWITQVLDRRDRQLVAELKAYGLRALEWRALATLYSRQRLSMQALADHASIERSTLSRTIERMVHAGWIVRLADANDMRVTRLALTTEGERLFERIWPMVSDLNDAACATLPPGMEALVLWAFKEMRRNLDESLARGDSERDEDAA
jgi:DNA-binding MarR family transcriptional regulator